MQDGWDLVYKPPACLVLRCASLSSGLHPLQRSLPGLNSSRPWRWSCEHTFPSLFPSLPYMSFQGPPPRSTPGTHILFSEAAAGATQTQVFGQHPRGLVQPSHPSAFRHGWSQGVGEVSMSIWGREERLAEFVPREGLALEVVSNRNSILTSLTQTRLLCPWNSPGKNTGLDSHSLLQGIFPTQGLNPVFCIAGSFLTI